MLLRTFLNYLGLLPRQLINNCIVWDKGGRATQKITTQREDEVFQYLVSNYTTKQIASMMNISEKTVRNHISNVILKLNVTSRTQAVLELIRLGQLKLEQEDN